ncbi:YaiI/YqxD family protein [Inmirania thermothiophila]|uniref:UPF0178 protein EDC57_1572 n=1 Tax=Inmirania thermothiophila TaxID=1750597 RepID=A0A3N1Y0K9_9GAMM|nr:YaiI/YqxD family protein [Inmirania thermothiophila]ROR32373.1 hypothetical protein EDC57_1572 [Inmirania thermothiophila]
MSAIHVDADACPAPIREILLRAAVRSGVALVFVANRPLRLPRGVEMVVVPGGPDAADRHIAASVQPGDLVVTADIPLAAQAVARGALALDPRGTLYTEDNIGERLATRDLLAGLREQGTIRGGGSAPGRRERQAFAAALDRWLARRSA